MIDLVDQAQVLLRNAGYSTSPIEGEQGVLRFEDEVVLGFLHVFPDVKTLLSGWRTSEKALITRFAPQLRLSRDKAWNVYTVFVTEAVGEATDVHKINAIEEDFVATRKIVRAGVRSSTDLHRALLPLLPLRAADDFKASDYETKIRSRLSMLPTQAVDAILGSTDPEDIARILMERT